ncbi:MAG: thioredoxin domain-containing protein [Burkholderiaceae bacterium]
MTSSVWVACLCAQWCHICRDLQSSFDAGNSLAPPVRWVWVDIEDQADLLGDLEVDTFPTFLIGSGDDVLLYAPGPTQPDALTAFIAPYASRRMRPGSYHPDVHQAFQAIKASSG